jgi:hypothetical protein
MQGFSYCSPLATYLFEAKSKQNLPRTLQAKPKTKSTGHPTLDLELQIKGYGPLRGKACLLLTETLVSVITHASRSTPKTVQPSFDASRSAFAHLSGTSFWPSNSQTLNRTEIGESLLEHK